MVRIKSGKKSSVLKVFGSASTAGNYKCIATNLAGRNVLPKVEYWHRNPIISTEL